MTKKPVPNATQAHAPVEPTVDADAESDAESDAGLAVGSADQSEAVTDSVERAPRSLAAALSLIVFGILGFIAAFSLTMDKFALLENPDAQLGCNFSVLVGCSTNLNSAQGEVFGFPNSLLGLVFWSVAITIGVAILAGAHFAKWFWALFALAATGAIALISWFIGQSLFVLHVLCPWCMVTWAVTIPTFLVVVLHFLRLGAPFIPDAVRRFAVRAFAWIPIFTLACYLVVAVIAQVQLDVISEFIR